MIPNFKLTPESQISKKFIEKGILDFNSACEYVKNIPIGRITSRNNFALIFDKNKGTCSTKHALLNLLAEENDQSDIELMFGIYLISPKTHPQLTILFKEKGIVNLPESHCFLRYKGKRYDFTYQNNLLNLIESKIVRQQRIEPNQVGEWKEKIHQDYLMRWLKRKPELTFSLDEIWKIREECQQLLNH
jgi:hypothetical protein